MAEENKRKTIRCARLEFDYTSMGSRFAAAELARQQPSRDVSALTHFLPVCFFAARSEWLLETGKENTECLENALVSLFQPSSAGSEC